MDGSNTIVNHSVTESVVGVGVDVTSGVNVTSGVAVASGVIISILQHPDSDTTKTNASTKYII